jgi:hypothetical protein
MRDFAHDKMRHAQLAWDIHRWASGRIEESEVLAIDEASRRRFARILPGAGAFPRRRRRCARSASLRRRRRAPWLHAVLDGIAAEGPDMAVAVGS